MIVNVFFLFVCLFVLFYLFLFCCCCCCFYFTPKGGTDISSNIPQSGKTCTKNQAYVSSVKIRKMIKIDVYVYHRSKAIKVEHY